MMVQILPGLIVDPTTWSALSVTVNDLSVGPVVTGWHGDIPVSLSSGLSSDSVAEAEAALAAIAGASA